MQSLASFPKISGDCSRKQIPEKLIRKNSYKKILTYKFVHKPIKPLKTAHSQVKCKFYRTLSTSTE